VHLMTGTPYLMRIMGWAYRAADLHSVRNDVTAVRVELTFTEWEYRSL
jgi:hypothetical protein